MKTLTVLDSFISYEDHGSGSPMVFLHGNPLSSHVWRNILPPLAGDARTLAPDLIGMGCSGKPVLDYRFADHVRYLDAWFEALVPGEVTLVGHDWGGVLALDWAARHPQRVRGVAVFETFLKPMQWSDWSAEGAQLFKALRTPGAGESLVLEQNAFLEKSLAHGVKRGLAAADREVYYAPFATSASRRPMLQWPREIPIDGTPEDVAAVVERFGRWLGTSDTSKLLIAFAGPSVLGSPALIEWARLNCRHLDIHQLGPAGHHAQEDLPEEIGESLRQWYRERVRRRAAA